MPAGRPNKFKSVPELQKLIDDYFRKCEETEEPLTVTGLVLAMGTTRETLAEYEKKPEFSATIKTAKLKVEQYAEKMLFIGKSAAGPIFALKNFGWTDKTEQELYGPGKGPIQTQNSIPDADKEIIERFVKERQ
jgi:hypothetical protein